MANTVRFFDLQKLIYFALFWKTIKGKYAFATKAQLIEFTQLVPNLPSFKPTLLANFGQNVANF